jgi:hypothetical protein
MVESRRQTRHESSRLRTVVTEPSTRIPEPSNTLVTCTKLDPTPYTLISPHLGRAHTQTQTLNSTPYTLHPTTFTLRPTLSSHLIFVAHILKPKPQALNSTPYTLQPTLSSHLIFVEHILNPNPKLYTLHPTSYTLISPHLRRAHTQTQALNSTPYTLHPTSYTLISPHLRRAHTRLLCQQSALRPPSDHSQPA